MAGRRARSLPALRSGRADRRPLVRRCRSVAPKESEIDLKVRDSVSVSSNAPKAFGVMPYNYYAHAARMALPH